MSLPGKQKRMRKEETMCTILNKNKQKRKAKTVGSPLGFIAVIPDLRDGNE